MKKYKLPPTSDEYLRYTLEEMAVEFWEDRFEEHPAEAIMEGEEVVFKTGDALIDKWEEQLAKGEDPDLDEALSDEDKAWVEAQRAKAATKDGFRDDYTGRRSDGSKDRPRPFTPTKSEP